VYQTTLAGPSLSRLCFLNTHLRVWRAAVAAVAGAGAVAVAAAAAAVVVLLLLLAASRGRVP
jgi:hypothetical protein